MRQPPICACGCGEQTSNPRAEYKKGHRRGALANRWKGGRYYNRGYVYVYAPDHPYKTKRDQVVMEHRLVAEEMLGRYLWPWEQVHHINGIKDDNRPENLEVLTASEHGRRHPERLQKMWAAQTTDERRAAGLKGAEARWGRR